MKLSDLNDHTLVLDAKKYAQSERDTMIKVLHYLREIERRRLFSKYGHESIHKFAVKELCYSDGQASRRIAAMRLLQEVPTLEGKLSSGMTNISNLGLAQSFFNHEKKALSRPLTTLEKTDVLLKIENLSTREAEKVVTQMSSQPETLFSEKVRTINAEFSEVKFAADQLLLDKFEQIKGLLAHKLPQASMREIQHAICDIAIAKLSPATPPTSPRRLTGAVNKKAVDKVGRGKVTGGSVVIDRKELRAKARRIPASVRRAVWQRDQSRCAKCGSKYAPQTDHVIPVATGGTNEIHNLRLLCRACNQRAAIEHFGVRKMDLFL